MMLAVGLSNILDSKGREDIFGSSPVKRTHGTEVASMRPSQKNGHEITEKSRMNL